MKIVSLLSWTIVVLSAAGFIRSQSLRAESPKQAVQTDTASVFIPVKGMSCMACLAKTKRTLSGVAGVKEVEVKLSPGSATVKYDRSKVTPEKLASVINDLGYQAAAPALKTAQ